jgi:hypothetical protein
VFPPIIFPKPAINTTSPSNPKVSGSFAGQVDAEEEPDSDSSSDSWEEADLEDEHKMCKLRQAIVKGQPITIEIRAEYVYGGGVHEVILSREFKVGKPPSHILEPYQLAYKQIEQIGAGYQGGLPSSCIWTDLNLPRDRIEVTVSKRGAGIYVRYGFSGSSALDMANLPERIRVVLPLDWTNTFASLIQLKNRQP